MSGILSATVIGGGLGIYGASRQRSAAKDASRAQVESSNQAINENRRQFDAIVELMAPYVEVGQGALENLQDYAEPGQDAFQGLLALNGMLGAESEADAINAVRESEKFKILQELGQESILNNAAVTGGLRGGRVQGALAEFSPALLQELVDERYSRLGGIASLGYTTEDALARMGQSSAAQQGAFGQQTASSVAGLLGDIGASKAGYALARGQSQVAVPNAIMGAAGTGLGLYTGFGGTIGGNSFDPTKMFKGF